MGERVADESKRGGGGGKACILRAEQHSRETGCVCDSMRAGMWHLLFFSLFVVVVVVLVMFCTRWWFTVSDRNCLKPSWGTGFGPWVRWAPQVHSSCAPGHCRAGESLGGLHRTCLC